MNINRRKLLWLGMTMIALGICGLIGIGSFFTMPRHCLAGLIPGDLPGETILIPSTSGSSLHGWFVPGKTAQPVVILMHGVRGNRCAMLGRARFLHQAGYGVLLFDFQAHGESPGKHITFGYLESKDAQAAVEFVHSKVPGAKIALIGCSLGGAAALLAEPPLQVDAMVLEMVYPTIEEAISDRLAMRLGAFGRPFTPLLSWQIKPRLGISMSQLRPIDHVGKTSIPKFFIAGTADHHTLLSETEALFNAANGPKEFWPVPDAGHIDLHAHVPVEYQRRVLAFFEKQLAN